MGIFSKSKTTSSSDTQFPRTILHQAIWGHGFAENWRWVNLKVLHLELNTVHILKLIYNGEVFEKNDLSGEASHAAMKEIRDNAQSLATLFPAVNFSDFTEKTYTNFWQGKGIGFLNPVIKGERASALKMLIEQEDRSEIDSMDTLSRGNFVADLFEDESYIPTTEREIEFVSGYLADYNNFDVGLFGNFKHILKTLTARFQTLVEGDSDSQLIPSLAGCLGDGYGTVEAYLSKGHLIPLQYLRDGNHLSKLSDFGGRAYPSLATAQYLSRKGVRVLNFIETHCPSSAATRFKLNVLNISDHYDERSSIYSNYQILVSRIIFGSSLHVISGRKVEAPQKINFEMLAKEFIADMNSEELSWVKDWVESLPGNNPNSCRLAFEVSQEIGSSFSINMKTIEYLSLSDSPRAEAFLLNFLSEQPDKLGWLDKSTWPSYLSKLSDETIDKVFEGYIVYYNNGYYSNDRLSSQWLAYCLGKTLTSIEVQISKKFIVRKLVFGDDLLKLLLKLAQHTQFEPFNEWQDLVSVRHTSTATYLLEFFGASPETDGIFSFIKSPNKYLIEIYAQDLATALYWDPQWTWGEESNKTLVNETLGLLLGSSNEHIRSIANVVVTRNLLSQRQITNFYLSLNDPKFMFEMFREALVAPDSSSLLGIFTVVGQEEKRTFWRMYGVEVEEHLLSHASFTKFFWHNLEKFPTYVVEVFNNYRWLPDKVAAEISPSAVAKLNDSQKIFFGGMLAQNPEFLQDKSLLRAVLIAPDAELNRLGTAYVKQKDLFNEYWLIMLESNLPVPSKAAASYLETQSALNDFEDKVLMALDSNNKFARTSALRILQATNSPKLLSAVMEKLAENRNQDTWSLVAKNMNLIEEARSLHAFTRRVFLSRRQGRAQKEQVKAKITTLVRSLSEIVDQDILVRMSLGSVAKDRDWALRQIALSNIELTDVKVDFSWKEGEDV